MQQILYMVIVLIVISNAKASLIGHWTFNQDGGTIIYDEVNHSTTDLTIGQVMGSTPFFVISGAGLHGGLGNACQFNNVDSYVMLLTKPEIFNFGKKDFTVTGWFKQTAVENLNNQFSSPSIIDTSQHNFQGIALMINRSGNPAKGRLCFSIKGTDGDNRHVNSDYRLDDGKWHWCAAQVKNKKMALWIDGVQQSRGASYGIHTSASQKTAMKFGGNSDNLCIDNFQIYDIALSQTQLKQIYHYAGNKNSKIMKNNPSSETAFSVVNPISSIRRIPNTRPIEKNLNTTLNVTATPDEFEPASIVIYTRNGLKNVILEVSDLKCANKTIPARNVDIRTVKCWYQAESAWLTWWKSTNSSSKGHARILVPELLLKDDSLVKVDYTKKINYIKLRYHDSNRYIDMSQENSTNQPGIKNSEFPVKDAFVLQPFNISAKSYKQIWFTIYVPARTQPGLYCGNIKVTADGNPLKILKLNLEVLPFKLSEPKTYYDITKTFVSSIYHKGIITWNREGEVSGWYKTPEQFNAEIINMVKHGVTSPLIFQLAVDKNLEHLDRILEIRQEHGMINDPLYLLGPENNLGYGSTDDPVKLKQAQHRFMEIDTVAKKYGIKQVFIYGMDEGKIDKMAKQKPVWRALHEVGAKTFVSAKNINHEVAVKTVGDCLDLLIFQGNLNREIPKKWHDAGDDIWSYGNPQGGVENPEIYRRNYGLSLWKNNFDGACTYIYHHGYGHSWNDFDHNMWRDHNLTYPTVDGIIDTIAWEGYREGIDDIRYATTLKMKIEKALAGDNSDKRKIAQEANEWLEDFDINHCDLNVIRMKIINYILRIMEK